MSFDKRKNIRGAFGRKAYNRSAGRPSLDLDFTSGVLDPRITFSRAGTATYIDKNGVMQTAAANVPRFDHDPNKMVLEANFITHPENFENWHPNRVRVTTSSNVALAPNGLFTADKIIINNENNTNHSLGWSHSFVAGTAYTFSVYVKAAEMSFVNLRFSGNFPAGNSTFNLINGSVSSTGTASPSIENVGNGWFRCAFTSTANVTGAGQSAQIFLSNGSITIPVGNGIDGIYVWGAQLETGTVATQYSKNKTTLPTYACKGLLIEGSRTNLLLQSTNLTTANWAKYETTVSSTNITINGNATTVSKISETAADNYHSVMQAITGVVIGTKYSLQIKLRAAERTFAFVGFNGGGVIAFATINLQNGVISIAADFGGGAATFKATFMGDGVWLVTGTVTATATENMSFDVRSSYNGVWDNRQYVGTAGSGIYAWNPQLEVGANASSYIPTTTSAVTRAQDYTTMTGTNFSSWFKQTEGTFFAEYDINVVTLPRNVLSASRVTGSYGPRHQYSISSGNRPQYAVVDDSGTAVVPGLGDFIMSRDSITKSVFSYSLNWYGVSSNGDINTHVVATPPTQIAVLSIGQDVVGYNSAFGHMRNIKYWPHRLSNAKLQQLTKLRPTVDMSFTNNKLDSRVTFTRASTATYYDKDGVLRTAPINQPRFDYDPVTKQPKGMLIEGARTNILMYSEQFDSAEWGKTRGTITPNAAIASDGTMNADLFVSDAEVGTSRDIRRNMNTTVPTQYMALSCEFAAANANFITMAIRNRTSAENSVVAEFNISNGTISSPATNTGTAVGATAKIIDLGNGRYRCSISGKPDIAGTETTIVIGFRTISGNNAIPAFTPLAYVFGGQLEVGAYPSSYIPTTTAPVTRAADVANITGANFSSVFNLVKQGTLVFTSQMVGIASTVNDTIVGLFGDGVGNDITTFLAGAGPNYRTDITNTFLQNTVYPATIYDISTSGMTWSAASAYSTSNTDSTNTVDTTVTIPIVNKLSIGAGSTGANMFYLRNIRYWPDAVTTTQLQEFIAQ